MPPTITGARPGSMAPMARRSSAAQRREALALGGDRLSRQHVAVDALGVVRREAEVEGGDRGRGTGDGDAVIDGQPRVGHAGREQRAQLGPRRAAGAPGETASSASQRSVARTQPASSETARPPARRRPRWSRRRHRRSRRRRRPRRQAGEHPKARQARLLVAGQQAGLETGLRLQAREEVRTVGRVADGAGGRREAHLRRRASRRSRGSGARPRACGRSRRRRGAGCGRHPRRAE